ncbi:hypothetical protein H671_2g6230 [Cricetulus griseus]|uniref:Uncharacterized protein n=1 Tax=Cricetulus griseus TaxID=10029 RepID=A0A061IEP2_CRIGR|nr:hypothetical protein H671_2g6230 [Cricetulus griseus]
MREWESVTPVPGNQIPSCDNCGHQAKLRYVPVILVLSKTFIMKECWILSKAFSASSKMIMCFCLLQFVYMVDYINGFSYVEPSLHSWDEAKLIIVDDFSDVFLDWIGFC